MKRAAKKAPKRPATKRAKTTTKPTPASGAVPPVLQAATVLVLRCCRPNMTSSHGFVWPGIGEIATAPDWKPTKECGNGLHGWLWGEGDVGAANGLSKVDNAKWLVVEVDAAKVVELGGKVKFPSGKVVLVGSRDEATSFIAANGGHGRAIIYGTATAGYRGTATAGDSGTATAGDSGTATAGYRGTATAGYRGTATAGDSGTATAGDKGIILIRRWDAQAQRYRIVVGYPGEDGIEAGVAYVLDEAGKLTKKQ